MLLRDLNLYKNSERRRRGVQVKTENDRFTVVSSCSPQNLEFGYFTCCFAEDGKEMDLNLEHKCKVIVFPH